MNKRGVKFRVLLLNLFLVIEYIMYHEQVYQFFHSLRSGQSGFLQDDDYMLFAHAKFKQESY